MAAEEPKPCLKKRTSKPTIAAEKKECNFA